MLKRIWNKGLWLLNTVIGRVHLFFERAGFLKRIPFGFYKKIENSVRINHQYPLNFSEKDAGLFSHYTNYQSANEEVFELRQVNVSERGVVFSSFNNFAYAFPHVVFRADYGWLYLLGQRLFKKKTKPADDKTYILAYDFWSAANYYHWLIDSLPRLWIVREELASERFSLLLPAAIPKFVKASLAYFPLKNITYIQTNEFVHINRLLVPHYLAGSGHIHPVKVFALKNYLVKKTELQGTGKLVYVSRSKQKARRVINEDEVIKHLLPLGFEVVYFEDHTFEEQVAIGKGARVMVTSHGANLTNSLFMPENANVLELIREDNPNFCYWALCNAAKVNYSYQLCRTTGGDHLLVGMEQFKSNINRLLHG